MSVTTTSGRARLDRGEQRVEVAADGDDLELGLRLEQAPHALADEVVVLGEHEADRHAAEHTTALDSRGPIARHVSHDTLSIDRAKGGDMRTIGT